MEKLTIKEVTAMTSSTKGRMLEYFESMLHTIDTQTDVELYDIVLYNISLLNKHNNV